MRAFILLLIFFICNTLSMAVNEDSTQDEQTDHNYCDEKALRMLDFSSVSDDYPSGTWIRPEEHNSLQMQPCRPLVKPCSNGKNRYSICFNKNGTEVEIGTNMIIIKVSNGSVTYHFTEDAYCNATDSYSMGVKMICSHISRYVDVDDENKSTENCHFHVTAKVSTACPKRAVQDQVQLNDDKCQFTDLYGDITDLSRLNEKDFYIFSGIKLGNESHTFRLSLCGGKKVCNDSYICDDKMSYGRNIALTTEDTFTNIIKFHFTNGSQCADGSNAQSTLYIKCNESAVLGELTVLSNQYCNLELEWATANICPEQPSFTEPYYLQLYRYMRDIYVMMFFIILLLVILFIADRYTDLSEKFCSMLRQLSEALKLVFHK